MSHRTNNVTVRRLSKQASEDELQKIIDVYDDAFSTDSFMSYIVGGYNGHVKNPSLLSMYNRAAVCATLAGGQIYVAEIPESDAGIVGAALWFGPGEDFLSSEEQRSAGWTDFMEKLCELEPDMDRWYQSYFIPKLHASDDTIVPQPSSQLKSWYLMNLAVSSKHQRKGIGSTLIQHCERLAIADPTASPESLFLSLETETPQALKLYKTLGFQVKAELDIEAPKDMGGSEHMWRLVKEISCDES